MPAHAAPIPRNSLIFGYGPMLPLAAAAFGAWLLPPPWPAIATDLAILWGALILAFVAGVRRGFGFGVERVALSTAIGAMLAYFVPAGVALMLFWAKLPVLALALLAMGYALVAALDRHAARRGDAPAHFARLRPPQMGIAVLALAGLIAHAVLASGG
jgi:uncharacterized membrane protein